MASIRTQLFTMRMSIRELQNLHETSIRLGFSSSAMYIRSLLGVSIQKAARGTSIQTPKKGASIQKPKGAKKNKAEKKTSKTKVANKGAVGKVLPTGTPTRVVTYDEEE